MRRRDWDYETALKYESAFGSSLWDKNLSALCFVDHLDCASLIPQDTLSQMERAHGSIFDVSQPHDVIFKCAGELPTDIYETMGKYCPQKMPASMIILSDDCIGLKLQLSLRSKCNRDRII